MLGFCCSFFFHESLNLYQGGYQLKSIIVSIIQLLPKPHPDFPRVPLTIDNVKNEEGRQLIQAGIHDVTEVTPVYAAPPGTPKDRVQILRKAFQDTLRDPEFVAEAKKANLEIDPLTGEEVEKIVAELFNISPSTVSKLAAVLAVK